MINQLIQQLQDSNPEIRRRAILALGKSKDTAALKPLAAVVRGDPDPALRDLARKAGQYIRQQNPPQPPAATPPQTAPLISEPSAPPKVSPFVEEEVPDPPVGDDLPMTGALISSRYPPKGYTPRQWYEANEEAPETGAPVTQEPPDSNAPRRSQLRSLDTKDLPKTGDLIGDEEKTAPAPSYSSLKDISEEMVQMPAKGATIVRGRKYNVSKGDQDRAKQYIDTALSLNINGDNARAMKNLTEALSLNPNLINDQYFNNVASAVTGLDGDDAMRMIIDYRERKNFTQNAAKQQKEQRVEKHVAEASTASWTDVWFEVGLYAIITIVGSIVVAIFAAQGAQALAASFAQSTKDLPEAFRNSQTAISNLTVGALLPNGIIAGVTGVIALLVQTALIHVISIALKGTGTWRNLIRVLVGFYNKWYLIFYAVLSVTLFVTFWSAFSPISLCFFIAVVILGLYVTVQTSNKVGEAYDFGGGKGCLSVTLTTLVILLIYGAIGYAMWQALAATIAQVHPG